MKPLSIEQWQQTADYVLAPLVAEEMVDNNNAHYWKLNQANILAYHFPDGQYRLIYKAVSSLILQSKPVHITTLQTELNGSIPPEYLMQLYAMYKSGSTLSGGVFDANLETLKSYGERAAAIAQLKSSMDTLIAGGEGLSLDNVVSNTVTGLISMAGDTIENETADKMADDFVEYMSVEPKPTLSTGVRLIDDWIGGFAKGDFMAIAAPMKQRKTSLVLNMLIHMARCGHSVALMMLESNKQMVNAMIVSMMAIEFLLKHDKYHDSVQGGKANHIHAASLVKMRARYRHWKDIRVAAVDYGIAEFRKIESRLRVYDRTRNGGSLHDAASIHRVCLRDKALYGTDFIAIDHAQRIHVPGVGNSRDYEKLTAIVPFLEGLARREDIAMCLLAQLKAGEAEGTGDTHISGVRGGSVLDEAVDYMLITGYKQKMENPTDEQTRYPNDVLMVGLQHSRYGDGGSHKREFIPIDPNSGYIPYGGSVLHQVDLTDSNIVNPHTKLSFMDLD